MKTFNPLDLAEESGFDLSNMTPVQRKAFEIFAKAIVRDVGRYLHEVDPDFNDYCYRMLKQRYKVSYQ